MPVFNPIQQFLIWAIPALFAITLHEVAHGWVALKCGDRTAQMLGRLTLNPIKHIDLVGTIIVPAILYFLSGFIFGWAKPVPVNPRNFRNPRPNSALVAFAGPGANLLMMALWALVMKLGSFLITSSPWGAQILMSMGYAGILINILLAVVNLIPIPPLDGSRLISSCLSPAAEQAYSRLEPYGFWIILALMLTGVLSRIIMPIISLLHGIVMSLLGIS